MNGFYYPGFSFRKSFIIRKNFYRSGVFHMPKRLKQLENWLTDQCGLDQFDLKPASGDASFRRYFRLSYENGETHIAMDAPPDKESCEPFVRIARQFEALGLNVPSIIAEDFEQGFLLLKDLGDTQYLDVLSESNVDRLYGDALHALITLQKSCDISGLPAYNENLLLNEMNLFRDWLLGKQLSVKLSGQESDMLDRVFAILVKNALEQPRVCVHRDYHSRNLMYNDVTEKLANPGILDFQDAVAGPITYDLVSLIKDCYIDWPRSKVVDWAMGYCELCIDAGLVKPEQKDNFLRWFDLMGVQRHLKAAGIFARLNIRDGKPGYLKDIPRTLGYIRQLESEYAELSGLVELIKLHVRD